MKQKTYLWLIPFMLSVICGLINPYGGVASSICTILSIIVLIALEKSIKKDVISVKEGFNTKKEIALDLFATNWMLSAVSFFMVNAILNLTIFYYYWSSISKTGFAHVISFIKLPVFRNNMPIVCILFSLSIILHGIGVAMIFIEGRKIKNQIITT